MGATLTLASIGDHGILNHELSGTMADAWLDRDLGWLDFNDRVLAEALDSRTPLLERVKFLTIFTANLDEFFMKRVTLFRGAASPERQAMLANVRERIIQSLKRQAECFRNELLPGLASHGIHLRTWDALSQRQQEEAGGYFDSEISPALTPLVFDPAYPFPFLSSLSTSLAFSLHGHPQQAASYARVKVPSVLKQWLGLQADVPARERVFVSLHEVIRGNIQKLYNGMELTGASLFRLTRDADVEIDEDSDLTLPEMVKEQVRQRRYEPVVRLEFAAGADPAIIDMLSQRFNLSPIDIYELAAEVDYTSLLQIASLPVPDLRDAPWVPITPPAFVNSHDVFTAIRAADVLVHHPYESFDASVEHFIAAAAADPDTVAVKMTAYRVGDDTPFVKNLVKAAEAGKQVACVIEIKARFDEERNLHWAAELERAGAHVTFGVRGLKTHAKIALVVRQEDGGLRSYVHIGTGNYHVRTARLYADFGLFTCNPAITNDVVNLFHYLTGHSEAPIIKELLVAPTTLRTRLLELIAREVNNQRMNLPARIVAKMNQLEDPEIIEALFQASNAGVPVDLIVRGFCCLRPGVPGRTENVRVRSIIGRYLEHSRIFHFAAGQKDPLDGEFFIGSADWMFRNLSKRIELVTPVTAKETRERLWETLDICLRDTRQAWVLDGDGHYSQLQPANSIDGPQELGTHETLMALARHRMTA